MTLGLAMIVRNEGPVIERCLASVRDKIDAWTIVDTGSTDDTRIRIQAALDGIPGQLLDRPWRNFGENRTELLGAAHNKTDWVVCLDADMTLDSVGEYPDGAAGLVRYTGPTDYAQPLLLSGRVAWRYVGKTHEYVEPITAGARTVPAPGWLVTHHADGSSRSEKFSRDLELLLPEAEAGDPRSMFYVARTYVDILHNDAEIVFADKAKVDLKEKALHWFDQRSEAGGWDEEVFMAKYQAGVLAWDHDRLMEAALARPGRAEPWLFLAQIAVEKGQHTAALALCEHGLSIPYPFGDTLFVERWIYEWGLRLERSAAAWHTGDLTLCASDSLALLGTPPDWIRERVQRNLDLCRR